MQAIILTVVLILGIFSFTINEMPQLLGILVGYLALVLIFIELFISKLDYNFKLSFKWGGHITLWICTLLNIFNDNTLALIILYFIYMLLKEDLEKALADCCKSTRVVIVNKSTKISI